MATKEGGYQASAFVLEIQQTDKQYIRRRQYSPIRMFGRLLLRNSASPLSHQGDVTIATGNASPVAIAWPRLASTVFGALLATAGSGRWTNWTNSTTDYRARSFLRGPETKSPDNPYVNGYKWLPTQRTLKRHTTGDLVHLDLEFGGPSIHFPACEAVIPQHSGNTQTPVLVLVLLLALVLLLVSKLGQFTDTV